LAEKDKKFYDVVARPSLLYIVAILWRRARLSERSHLNSAEVIELFIKHTLQRQQTKHDERQFMILNSAERLYFMMGIAAYMAAKNLPNQIDKLQLEEAVRQLITAIPDAVSQNVGTLQGEDSRPLSSRQRFEWDTRREEIIHKINTDVRSCGLLVTDLSKDGSFKFAHKSYMELLQAQVIFNHSFASDKFNKLSGQSIANNWKLGAVRLQNPEVFNFFVELLSTHLHQQGMSEESTIVKCLWNILVIAKFSNRHTVSSFLTKYWVLSASWLINSINWFGLKEPREIIINGLSVFVIILSLGLIVISISVTIISIILMVVVRGEVPTRVVLGRIVPRSSRSSSKREVEVVNVAMVREIVQGSVGIVVAVVDGILLGSKIRMGEAMLGVGTIGVAIGMAGQILFKNLLQLGWLWHAALSLTSLIVVINLLLVLILGLAIDFLNTSYLLSDRPNSISKRLHLWYSACVSLGFAPETIEKVVGKGMTKLLAEVEEKWRNLR